MIDYNVARTGEYFSRHHHNPLAFYMNVHVHDSHCRFSTLCSVLTYPSAYTLDTDQSTLKLPSLSATKAGSTYNRKLYPKLTTVSGMAFPASISRPGLVILTQRLVHALCTSCRAAGRQCSYIAPNKYHETQYPQSWRQQSTPCYFTSKLSKPRYHVLSSSSPLLVYTSSIHDTLHVGPPKHVRPLASHSHPN
jgi:hypothetical protein